MRCPRVAIFDLDDTLAESFHAIPSDTLEGLRGLLRRIPVAVITGATFSRMEEQFLPFFETHPRIDQFYIFPVCSAQAYGYGEKGWHRIYDLALAEEDRLRIEKTISDIVSTMDMLRGIPHDGQQLVNKGSQVAYTHVGVEATRETKDSWDPDGSKRTALWNAIRDALPEFEVLMGGKTTIDITRKEINKAYGVQWLSTHLGIPASEMLYVGDALYPGGNDAVVIPTGIETRSVSSPEETKEILKELLAACSA